MSWTNGQRQSVHPDIIRQLGKFSNQKEQRWLNFEKHMSFSVTDVCQDFDKQDGRN